MDRQTASLRVVAIIGVWLLCAATYPIWIQHGEFPQIPFFGWLTAVPAAIDYCFLSVAAISSLVSLSSWKNARWRRSGCAVAAYALIALALLDQHRFQPWVYLAIVQLLVLAWAEELAVRLLRWVYPTIYLFSAVSKFDRAFFDHLGLRFVDTLLELIGRNPHLIRQENKLWVVWLIPIGELLIGTALPWTVTRSFAVGASIALHATLIFILGPWGLGHHFGVLIWNVLFALQVFIVFRTRTKTGETEEDIARQVKSGPHTMRRAATMVVSIVILLPFLELVGWTDHWPAWSLYSDRTDKIELFIAENESEKLPPGLSSYIGQPRPFQTWRKVYLEQWTLDSTYAPSYPEDRYQVGLAMALVERHQIRDFQLQWYGPPNRWSGERTQETYEGRQEIRVLTNRFRLNTKPRR